MLAKPLGLVVHDESGATEDVRSALTENVPARLVWARTLRRAVELLGQARPDFVVTDLRLPDAAGVEIVRALRRASSALIVVLTAHGNEALAAAAILEGAQHYVVNTPGFDHELRLAIEEHLGRELQRSVDLFPTLHPRATPPHAGIVGGSPELRHCLWLARRAARSRIPVLITGETGTGKEAIARIIHEAGPNPGAPFRSQNCGALPDALLGPEIFGHVRGAFTSADRDRAGLFLDAREGTVFLDEVGDASPSLQAGLLRVLQEGEVKPVGSDRTHASRARVIAATHHDLALLVRRGSFRRDLFYRLSVFPIHLPPLRDRPDDVAPLIEHFKERYQLEEGRTLGPVTPDTLAVLRGYDWPGNVRELQHEIHRLVLTHPQSVAIAVGALAPHVRAASHAHGGERLDQIVRRVELAVLRDRIRRMPSKAAAARSLGITREALYWKLKRLEAEPPDRQTPED